MKRIPLFLLTVFLLPYLGLAQEAETQPAAPRLMDSKTGNDVSVSQLVSDLARCDVVFLGEKHDNDSGHAFQLDVLKELVNQGRTVVVSTEQFERDVQGAVDDYLGGRIEEDAFLAASRPWKNYQQHYRPIIEFAKSNRIPVLAANVPRQLASDYSSGKATTLDSALAPRETTAPKNAYWQNFAATMKGHIGADGAEKMDRFFASQCLKDDAMAESITDYLATNTHQNKIIVHLCGHFHSDYGLGTVSRVVRRNPLARYVVVTMETPPKTDSQVDASKMRARGHYVFWATDNSPTEDAVVPDDQ